MDRSTPSWEERVFALACGMILLHVVVDATLGLNPGVSAGDHWPRVLVAIGVGAASIAAYPRLGAGLQATLAFAFGAFALVGAGGGIALAVVEGIEASTLTGFALVPAAAALVVLGARVLWRSRKPDGHRYLRRGMIAIAGLVGAFEVLVPIGFAWIATHRPAEPAGPADLGRPYDDVTVETADGLELAAWSVPSRNGASVITFPSRDGATEEARMLARNGYGVLALDMRGYGESDGDPNAFGWGATADIDAAVSYLRSRPDTREGSIGGLGLSVGGEQMLEAASENPDLAAVVSEGAGERSVRETLLFGPEAALTIPQQAVMTAALAVFGGEAPPPALDDVAAKIAPRSVFFIIGEEGQPGEELNHDYFEAAGEPKEIWTVPDAGHTGGLAAQPEDYERRVTEFFERALDITRAPPGRGRE